MPKNKKLALNSGIQTNQILTNDDEVCIPRLSSILLAVPVWSIISLFFVTISSVFQTVKFDEKISHLS